MFETRNDMPPTARRSAIEMRNAHLADVVSRGKDKPLSIAEAHIQDGAVDVTRVQERRAARAEAR
jgi:hypothetical protein